MKIPENDPSLQLDKTLLAGTGAASAAKGNPTSKAQEGLKTPASDQVNISEKARSLQQLNQLVANAPTEQSEKIAKLQKEIDAGTYQPDLNQLANKLVQSTLFDNVA